jgi:hypothetical protein
MPLSTVGMDVGRFGGLLCIIAKVEAVIIIAISVAK